MQRASLGYSADQIVTRSCSLFLGSQQGPNAEQNLLNSHLFHTHSWDTLEVRASLHRTLLSITMQMRTYTSAKPFSGKCHRVARRNALLCRASGQQQQQQRAGKSAMRQAARAMAAGVASLTLLASGTHVVPLGAQHDEGLGLGVCMGPQTSGICEAQPARDALCPALMHHTSG